MYRLGSKSAVKLNYAQRLSHITVSPPQKEVGSVKDFQKLLKECYRLLKRKGVRGGLVIVHPFRVTEKGKSISGAAKIWKRIRALKKSTQQLLDEGLIYYSWHFHVVAYHGFTSQGGAEDDKGWVFKVVRCLNMNGHSWNNSDAVMENVRRVVYYQLSHTVYVVSSTKVTTTRWFGSCSYNKFPSEPKPILGCPVCGGDNLVSWNHVARSCIYGTAYLDQFPPNVRKRIEDEVVYARMPEKPTMLIQ